MKSSNSICTLVLVVLPLAALSQTSTIPMGTKDYDLLDRLEIKSGDSNLNFSTSKPYNRRLVTKEVQYIDSLQSAGAIKLTEIDKYNIQRFLIDNNEWGTPGSEYLSKKVILKHFYKTPSNLLK